MIRVVLVDDHELVRTGFRMILAAEADIEVVGEAGTGEEGIELTRRLKPDVVLMDVNLPGISGIEATERLARGGEAMRVIVVTMQDQQPFPKRLLEVGASGYLSKGCAAVELIAAVRSVARGDRYISTAIARLLALESLSPRRDASPFEALSPRELEIALAVAQGQQMPDIAKRMALSAKTVATYKYRVYEKLGVENEVALSNLAIRYGIIMA
jgi:two-component system, NarL family, invasion response regulator UvrY